VIAFQYPDPDTVPGDPVDEGDADVLVVVSVTEVKVLVASGVLVLVGVVTGVVEITKVVEVPEVLGMTDVLPATEELDLEIGVPDFGKYLTPVAGQVDLDPSVS
jgi:hypothetical protein